MRNKINELIKRILIKYLIRNYGYSLGEGMYQHGYETGKCEVEKNATIKGYEMCMKDFLKREDPKYTFTAIYHVEKENARLEEEIDSLKKTIMYKDDSACNDRMAHEATVKTYIKGMMQFEEESKALKSQIRSLKYSAIIVDALQEKIQHLREDVSSLKKENAELKK